MDKRNLPDIRTVPLDLVLPSMTEGMPQPGRRIKQVAAPFQDTEVHHALYLPTDWRPRDERDQPRYPLIVEYAGNGPYSNTFGDTCSGEVEDCSLGYGISGGAGFIWVCLPYISLDGLGNQRQWWGDVDATVTYCLTVVSDICRTYGGDSSAILLAGFSRGAIACNYSGLHDDRIAGLWRAFIAHSHYDGVRTWDYAGSDRHSAVKRLQRLRDRAQFISHEGSVQETRDYLEQANTDGRFTFQALPYRNHTDTWVLRDIPERKTLREWVRRILAEKPPSKRTRTTKEQDL
jgi:hypothetical protein